MPFSVAISGLKAASTDLNVIGNNIANTGTTGFKQSRAEFADVYAVSGIGTAANAAGNGTRLARIAQQFSQGNIGFTNNNLDLAINGEGFFVVDDNGTRLYTRAGAFGVDNQGFIVNAQSQRLVAFQADSTGAITGALGSLQLSSTDIAPGATTTVTLGLNLDASASVPTIPFSTTNALSYNNSTSTTIYDSLGTAHLVSTYYRKTADNTWETYVDVDGTVIDGPDTLQFSSAGALIAPATGTLTTPSFTPSGGGAPMTLTLDYSSSTQFGANFGVNSISQDGFTTGRLVSIDIDPQGIVFARFSNGQAQAQGQVVLANFANEQGLSPLGDTTFQETFSSGTALLGAPGSSSLGLIQSGALEESNVELSEQLVKMIIAQRNFQANAEVISTADAITQTIINMR